MGIELLFDVSGNVITRRDINRIAGNSVDFVLCRFKFDETWNGLTKTALFENMAGESYDVLLGTGSEAEGYFASEALAVLGNGGGFAYVSVRGIAYEGNETVIRGTANKIYIPLEPNGAVSGAENEPVTPTVPEQVIAALAKSQWKTGTAITGTGTGISATVENAVAGMHYINETTSNVYTCIGVNGTTSTWDYVCSFKGIPGAKGEQGEGLYVIDSANRLDSWRRIPKDAYNNKFYATSTFDYAYSLSENDYLITIKRGFVYQMSYITGVISELYSTNGADGTNGTNGIGISDIVKLTTVGNVDTYSIILDNGDTRLFTVKNGVDGAKGDKGDGISDVVKLTTVGNVDTYSIIFDNGDTRLFTVKNGVDGAKGDKGDGITITDDTTELDDLYNQFGKCYIPLIWTGEETLYTYKLDSPVGAVESMINLVPYELYSVSVNVYNDTQVLIFTDRGNLKGAKGDKGDKGVTYTPGVSESGVISWTNNGGMENPPDVDLVSAVINALPSAVGVSF